jgi:hypothetical protein
MYWTAIFVTTSMVLGQPGTMPREIRHHLDTHLVGEWSLERIWSGQRIQGAYSAQWAKGKQCIVIQSTHRDPEGELHVTELLGWDSKARAVLVHGFTSDGTAYTIRWTGLKPDKWTGTGSGSFDGAEWTSETTIEWKKDSIRYQDVTDGKPFVVTLIRK